MPPCLLFCYSVILKPSLPVMQCRCHTFAPPTRIRAKSWWGCTHARVSCHPSGSLFHTGLVPLCPCKILNQILLCPSTSTPHQRDRPQLSTSLSDRDKSFSVPSIARLIHVASLHSQLASAIWAFTSDTNIMTSINHKWANVHDSSWVLEWKRFIEPNSHSLLSGRSQTKP